MTTIDIVSGFLGAGKTTLIRKLLSEALTGEKVVLIENEFGEVGIDGGFLRDTGIQVTEMNAGCICCSLAGDFSAALRQVLETYHPQRVLIEPSGVGKLSDVMAAVEAVGREVPLTLRSHVAVVDAAKCRMYLKNFGEFFRNQVENASAIFLSRTHSLSTTALEGLAALLRTHNPDAPILTTPWEELTGGQLLELMAGASPLSRQLLEEAARFSDPCASCQYQATCAARNRQDTSCGHDQPHGESCGHDHTHGEHCGHHHAHEVFTSWGRETPRAYDREDLQEILSTLATTQDCGTVLRAKGILPGRGEWLHFDLVPGEFQYRAGGAEYTGRISVIGVDLDEGKLAKLFHLEG